MTDTTDTAAFLDELAATVASHGTYFAALKLAELEQKVSPGMPPVPKPTSMRGDVSLAGAYGAALWPPATP